MALPPAASKDENPVWGRLCSFSLGAREPVSETDARGLPGTSNFVPYTLHSVVDRLAPPVPSHWIEDEEAAMDVLIERCAGIDIGKDEVVACVRTPASSGRGRRKQTRTFSSFTGALQEIVGLVHR
jgi:hypothetical protein